MSGHTPGPWSVPDFARPETNCECGYVLTDGYFGAVATVHASGDGEMRLTGDNPKFDEACANARLIASAPELLDACRAAEAFIAGAVPSLAKDRNEAIDAVLPLLRLALAKATGAQP